MPVCAAQGFSEEPTLEVCAAETRSRANQNLQAKRPEVAAASRCRDHSLTLDVPCHGYITRDRGVAEPDDWTRLAVEHHDP